MTILYNARIYTLDTVPEASSLVIEGDRIIAVGSKDEILNGFSSTHKAINLEGRTVLPGLADAHIHLEHYSTGLQKIDCETETYRECLQRVKERARNTPQGAWVLGHGWNQNSWEGGFGTAADLDRVAPDHPVYLTAKSLHASWANTRAFQIAGINNNSPDPEGGFIQRDQTGQPTGILFESAMELVAKVLPMPTEGEVAEAIHLAQPTLWRMGLTAAHDFDRQRCFAALQILHQRGELKLRVVKSIPAEGLEHAIAIGLRSGFGDDFIRIGSIKLFADGALGPQTAAMLQPYEGSKVDTGILLMDEEEIFELGIRGTENGLSLAIHAIGDGANHAVVNAYAQIRNYETNHNLRNLRHRIEHVQLLHQNDLARLSNIGVIASMQPIHATSDMLIADRFWGSRSQYSYAWQTLNNHQTRLTFGSDAPVESPNPFWGLHAAVTRQRRDGSPGPDGWQPEQRLSLFDAIKGYTIGAAYAAGLEHRQGKISPGYLADMIVLDRDPFTLQPGELFDLQPSATMIGGNWVWDVGLFS